MGYWNNELSEENKERFSKFFGKEVNYLCPEKISHVSLRYGETATVPAGYPSDGATFAIDIDSPCWFIHDRLCDSGKWDSGKKLTNWQCSRVISDVLHSEFKKLWARGEYLIALNRKARSIYWFWATFASGGGEARKNGLIKLKEG